MKNFLDWLWVILGSILFLIIVVPICLILVFVGLGEFTLEELKNVVPRFFLRQRALFILRWRTSWLGRRSFKKLVYKVKDEFDPRLKLDIDTDILQYLNQQEAERYTKNRIERKMIAHAFEMNTRF